MKGNWDGLGTIHTNKVALDSIGPLHKLWAAVNLACVRNKRLNLHGRRSFVIKVAELLRGQANSHLQREQVVRVERKRL